MQPFLQYRRFLKQLEQQVEHHGLDRVAGCATTTDPEKTGQRTRPEPKRDLIEARDHALEEKELQNVLPRGPGAANREDGMNEKLDKLDTSPYEEDGSFELPQPRKGSEGRTAHTPAISGDSSNMPFYESVTGPTPNAHATTAPTAHEDNSGSTLQETASLSMVSTKSQHDLESATTRETAGPAFGRTLTGINVRSRTTNEGGHDRGKVFIVDYQGDNDPLNPHNWSITKRMSVTALVALIGLIVGVASSIDSAALDQAAKEFKVSEVTESLATALYLIGFGAGAFFAAPISETVGRIPVYVATLFLFMVFVMASALAPNIGAQLVFRFFAGFFGSTPLTCAGGSLSDMWTASERTAAFPVFANSAFWGPILGPPIGGYIGQSSLSWRWCEWITLIWAGLIFALVFFLMPETYAPVLLKWKASHLRQITGDDRYMSSLEVQETKLWDRMLHNLYRPFVMFVYEPIVVLFTLYLTVVYIILFTFLTGFEYIFLKTYGLSQGKTFLIFVSLGVGFFGASALVPWVYKSYTRALAEAQEANPDAPARLPPERRLIFAIIAAPFLPIGLLWMAWTAYPHISVWSPIVACVPVGFAIMGIFISTYQYLIDSYEMYAASALVGATFIRYVAAGGMIPVSIPFYENLGVHWTLTVLGAISAIMVPVPYIFWVFGPRIRQKSKHATTFA